MARKIRVALAIVLGFATGPALARKASQIRCFGEPRENFVLPLSCLSLDVEIDGLVRESRPRELGLAQSDFYGGMHWGSWFSLHTDLRAKARLPEASDEPYHGPRDNVEKTTRSFFAAFGNPRESKIRLLLGRFDLPLGLNLSDKMPIWSDAYESNRYFATQTSSAMLSIWDGFGTILDIEASGLLLKNDRSETDAHSTEPGAFALRLSHDISPLSGTKLILTYYRNNHDGKRIGFATLNENPSGGRASIEWFRVYEVGNIGDAPMHQLIRFNYEGGLVKRERWVFEYEQELETHYLTMLGYDFQLTDYVMPRFAIGYYRNRFERSLSHWVSTLGIRSSL